MSEASARSFLWLVLILSAPWALVLVVALLRGYSISVTLSRKGEQDTTREQP